MSDAKTQRKWSQTVTERSDALDLEDDVFKQRSAAAIAKSLKRSAEASDRRKSSPFRAAMSMLNFYINRGGKNLPPGRKRTLEAAKNELRRVFGRAPSKKPRSGESTRRSPRSRKSSKRSAPRSSPKRAGRG